MLICMTTICHRNVTKRDYLFFWVYRCWGKGTHIWSPWLKPWFHLPMKLHSLGSWDPSTAQQGGSRGEGRAPDGSGCESLAHSQTWGHRAGGWVTEKKNADGTGSLASQWVMGRLFPQRLARFFFLLIRSQAESTGKPWPFSNHHWVWS